MCTRALAALSSSLLLVLAAGCSEDGSGTGSGTESGIGADGVTLGDGTGGAPGTGFDDVAPGPEGEPEPSTEPDGGIEPDGTPCKDECTAPGAMECSNGATATTECGDFDGDGCLEWGSETPCGAGNTCSNGVCATECADECSAAAAKQCAAGQNAVEVCGNWDADDCLEWNEPTECPQGATCSGGICDQVGCKNECTTQGAKQCAVGGFQACGDFDDDDCLEWGSVQPCEAGSTCSAGECTVASECSDECTETGAVQCSGDAIQTCGDSDDDDCLEWGDGVPCEDGEVCSAGACAIGCADECTEDGAKKCQGDATQACGDHDDDGCLEWSTPVGCPDGETCSAGTCASPGECSDECTEADLTKCEAGGVSTCGDYDDDTCLDWGSAVACAEGETCSEGACKAGCTDGCSTEGALQCEGAGTVGCGDFNEDGCLEWGSVTPCADGETCSNGLCSTTCTDECEVDGASACSGNGVQTCGDYDDDDCLDWSTAEACAEGESCSDGACTAVEDCTDECDEIGATVCDDNGVTACGDYDEDSCLEWGTFLFCALGETCVEGTCEAVSGEATCGEISECADTCDEDDGACWTGCINSGTEDGQAEYLDLLDCASFHQCGDNTVCIGLYCEGQVAGCFIEGTGDGTCTEIVDCVFGDCGLDNEECVDACEQEGTADAQDDYVSYLLCILGLCPELEEACLEQVDGLQNFCGVPLAECVDPGGEGLDCGELFECVDACAEGDEACLDACGEAASTVGAAEYFGLVNCANAIFADPEIVALCEGIEQTCLGAFCSYEYANCAASAEGELSCPEIFDCGGACDPDNDACFFDCFDQGYKVAQQGYIGVFLCLTEACGDSETPEEAELCLLEAQQDQCADFVAFCNAP